jgi:allene oxide cyclase
MVPQRLDSLGGFNEWRRGSMRLRLMAALAAGIVVGAVIQGAAFGGTAATKLRKPTTVHVIEHALTDTVVDTGAKGDSSGDLLTFHNPVFNAADTTQVGRDQGQCIRIAAGRSWECTWTTFLPGGHITVEGPFFDAHDSVVAVTGGTGVYRNARGAMLLRSRANGTEFDFVFRLLP